MRNDLLEALIALNGAAYDALRAANKAGRPATARALRRIATRTEEMVDQFAEGA